MGRNNVISGNEGVEGTLLHNFSEVLMRNFLQGNEAPRTRGKKKPIFDEKLSTAN